MSVQDDTIKALDELEEELTVICNNLNRLHLLNSNGTSTTEQCRKLIEVEEALGFVQRTSLEIARKAFR